MAGVGLAEDMTTGVLQVDELIEGYGLQPTEDVRSLGATVAASPREAAAGADAVITIVSDPPALAAVLKGPDGVLAGCRPARDLAWPAPITSAAPPSPSILRANPMRS